MADLETALRLQELLTEWYDHGEYSQMSADLARAFREYGIDLELVPEEEAVAKILTSRIRRELIESLRSWAARHGPASQKSEAGKWAPRLRRIVAAADPDPWSAKIRAAVQGPKKDVKALQELAATADVAATPVRHLTNLSTSLSVAGDKAGAIALLRRIQRQYPADFVANFNLGGDLARSSPPRWGEATGYFRAALALRPKSARAWSILGWSLSFQSEWDEALAACAEAIRLQPDHLNSYSILGEIHHFKGDPEAALAPMRHAVRHDPEDPNFRCRLGAVLLDLGDPEAALVEYQAAAKTRPNFIHAHAGIGAAYRSLALAGRGDAPWEKASAAYETAARIFGDHPTILFGRAGLLYDQGHLHDSVLWYRYQLQRRPYCRELSQYSGPAAAAMNDLAWKLVTDPDLAKWQPVRSVELAREAVDLQPRKASYWNTMGLAHYRSGNFTDAVADLRKAMELSKGGDVEDWLVLAMAQWKLGETSEARKWYDKADAWMNENQPMDDELSRFREEARQLLGIGKTGVVEVGPPPRPKK